MKKIYEETGISIIGKVEELKPVFKSLMRHERNLDSKGMRNKFEFPFRAPEWGSNPEEVRGIFLDRSEPGNLTWVSMLRCDTVAAMLYDAMPSVVEW